MGACMKMSTEAAVRELAEQTAWDSTAMSRLEFLLSKAEISGRLYRSYHEGGKRATEELIPRDTALEAVGLFRRFFDQCQREALKAKAVNALLKLNDRFELAISRDDLPSFQRRRSSPDSSTEEIPLIRPRARRRIDLVVLFWDSPIARAYLSVVDYLGYEPRKILHLISSKDLSTGRKVFSIFPGKLKKESLSARHFNSMNYWPRKLSSMENRQYQNFRNKVSHRLSDDCSFFDTAYQRTDLGRFSANVEHLIVEGINDPKVVDSLKSESGHVLFTGGGLLAKEFFALPAIRLLHVHPGYLPDIRGSDGVLWSLLLKGKPSASCFYMTPNIDDGPVIHRNYLDLDIDLSLFASDKTIDRYRMIFSYLDPWIRAILLGETLVKTDGLRNITATDQDERCATVFYTMHKRLQEGLYN